jgi:hypothetical protein
MAFSRRTQTAADDPLTPLAEVPAYAHLRPIRAALAAAQEARRRELDLILLEEELRRPTAGSANGPRAQMQRERLAALRAQAAPKSALVTDATGLPDSVALALRLAEGGKVEPTPDHAARVKQLRTELERLHDGQMAVEHLMNEARAEASFVVAKQLVGRHQAILRTVYETAVALSAAIEAERELIVSVLNAGYEVRPEILVRPALDAASRLGTLHEVDSQLSWFRRRLETQGVL